MLCADSVSQTLILGLGVRLMGDYSGRALASPEFKRNIWQIRCTYICMYVSVYVAIRRPRAHHAARMHNVQSITLALSHSK